MQTSICLSELLMSVEQIEEDVLKEADSYLILKQLRQLKQELENISHE